VAVVSISRIQLRRGRKTNLPQLASGELGWSIDTQELYIGNGAVAEGAPYVGNTKLLSEHDNLFQFADSYAYKSVDGYIQTSNTPNAPVQRTLQDRLDDIVSIRSFGANGDGSDQTDAFQRAIDQLYLNAANKGTPQARVQLIIEPGEYQLTRTINVPPFATIRGAGKDKTFINAGPNKAFQTVNETSTPGVYADNSTSTTLNQARNIEISGMTIQTSSQDGLALVSCKDSHFYDIRFKGTYNLGDNSRTSAAIRLISLSSLVSSNNNVFERIDIDSHSDGVYSDFDVSGNKFIDCNFDTADTGIIFGYNTVIGTQGQNSGPIHNTIENCTFDNIYREGIKIIRGYYNTSKSNKFYNVGNHGGTYGNAQTSNIDFGQNALNQSEGDWFKRTEELSFSSEYLVNYPFVAEISGPNISEVGYTYQIDIGEVTEAIKFCNLSATTARSYVIEYSYTSRTINGKRTGTIEIMADPENNNISMSDDYVYTGDTTYEQNLKFSAALYDENSDGTVDTLAITMLNLTNGDDGTITFKIKSKS